MGNTIGITNFMDFQEICLGLDSDKNYTYDDRVMGSCLYFMTLIERHLEYGKFTPKYFMPPFVSAINHKGELNVTWPCENTRNRYSKYMEQAWENFASECGTNVNHTIETYSDVSDIAGHRG